MIEKIIGLPRYSTLKRLQKKIKANAALVTSNPGGGLHGHLEFVRVQQYHCKQLYRGKFQITDRTAIYNTIHIRDEYNEQVNSFYKTIAVEIILKSQIIGTIDSIKELINSSTETTVDDIPKIFTERYGPIE